jgi:hypothetical protein
MPIVFEIWNLNLLEPSRAVQACKGIAIPAVNYETVLLIFTPSTALLS